MFQTHRGLLFGVAYRMLGSTAEAEDVVQESWLRWDRTDRSQVADPRAYLVRVATRLAIDQLRRAATRREAYVGPWLPEPLLTSPDVADEATLAESVSMAILVVLETLSPLERAVFVLHEAFGFSYPEIGAALGRSDVAIRQLSHRAREHVRARRPRFQPDRQLRRAATERFLRAAVGGDLTALLDVLAPDVTLVADGGGKVRAPRRPIVGRDKVARFVGGVTGGAPANFRLHFVDVNGVPAVVATADSVPFAVLVLDVEAETGRVTTIQIVSNPEKLAVLPPLSDETASALRGGSSAPVQA